MDDSNSLIERLGLLLKQRESTAKQKGIIG